MKNKFNGFLLLEAIIGLSISCFGIFLCCVVINGQQKILKQKNEKVDQYLAVTEIKGNDLKQVEISGYVYRIKNETSAIIYLENVTNHEVFELSKK